MDAAEQMYVNGYDHKLGVLLRAVTAKLANLQIAQERFVVVKDEVRSHTLSLCSYSRVTSLSLPLLVTVRY
jgi:secreted Zn-dependent insulinase-like peptidase